MTGLEGPGRPRWGGREHARYIQNSANIPWGKLT
jgi:hypothetical protein